MSRGFYAVCLVTALAGEIGVSSWTGPRSSCILAPLPNRPTGSSSYMLSAVLNRTREENNGRIEADSLRLILLNSEHEFDTIVLYVSTVFNKNSDASGNVSRDMCSEVIGVVGDLSSETASIIHTLAGRANLSVTLVSSVAPSTFLPVTNLVLPNVLDMHPLAYYAEALTTFCDELYWTRIALISDDTIYNQYAAGLLQKRFLQNDANEIIPYVSLKKDDSFLKAFNEIKSYGTYIIVVLMHGEDACSLLDAGRSEGMIWPKYAWVILDFNSSEETRICYTQENIVLFEVAKEDYFPCNNSAFCVHLYETVQETNSRLNYLGVLTTHLNLSENFYGTALPSDFYNAAEFTGSVNFEESKRVTNVSIFQIKNSSRIELAHYDAYLEHITFHSVFLVEGNSPQGSKLIVKFQTFLVEEIIFALVVALVFLFITAVLAFYIYFRKEPEIRATSVTVSLSMFLGCYLMLTNVPLYYAVHEKPLKHGREACHAMMWLCGIGLSPTIILATLIVKMLRVYVIFIKPLSYKKKFFSDSVLFLYILVIISPNIVTLTLWLGLNPLNLREFGVVHKNYVFVAQSCLVTSDLPWLIALILYINTLLTAAIIIAFKSTKIRYKHFKDAKETNAFAFIMVFTACMTFFYWWFHLSVLPPNSSNLKAAEIAIYAGHINAVVSCQMFLFVPKIYYPIKRLLLNRK